MINDIITLIANRALALLLIGAVVSERGKPRTPYYEQRFLKRRGAKKKLDLRKGQSSVQRSGNFGAVAGSSILEIARKRATHRSAAFQCVL
jgi:hypothetical protein